MVRKMEKNYPTPHIAAEPCDIAKTVLMPGDPKRSEFVAKNFLTDAHLFNDVRAVHGYTGLYKGSRVSVMASGMGMPSIGIYSHELYNIFGVENIIRIGSAGAMSESVHLRDIVLGLGACTDSRFGEQFGLPGSFAPTASYSLLESAVACARERGMRHHVGNILSTDRFYNDDIHTTELWRKMNVLAVEMEAAALYMNAARFCKSALAICTISDHLITHESTSAAERETTFSDMIELALEVALRAEVHV